MVDWDRVDQLRSKGWDWEEIAEDPKVGFQVDSSTGDPGRALRVLYHRRKGRGAKPVTPAREDKTTKQWGEQRWSLARIGFLLVPLVAVWFAIAFVAPSPVGLILAAIPWLALILAAVVVLLAFGLMRATRKWTKVYRNTLIGGLVLGLIFTGVVAIAAIALFGCPYLPPATSLQSQPDVGWKWASVSPWQDGGKPVVYFYGATWCPYCSASSWAIWKALTEFGSVSGAALSYSSLTDVSPGTPEVVLANVQLSSSVATFEVSEDTSGVGGNFPGTSSCYQSAYFTAYSGGSIPFLVINGQAVHGGTTIIDPTLLTNFSFSNTANHQGNVWMQQNVSSESTQPGSPWPIIRTQAWWIMAYITKACGVPVATLSSEFHWSSATTAGVTSDLSQL
jgi:thiol-disulfide isomerase/thioredoxin